MSGQEFFTNRYRELGWNYEPVKVTSAIRVNTVNIGRQELLSRLASRGIKLGKIPFLENGYWVHESKFSIGATSEYLLGLYSIQEAAAQIPASLFTELKNKTILDACAAPGGKTCQLADLMQNNGTIVALDIEKRRLTALSNQLERCRVKNTIVYDMDARQVAELDLKFDRILLDVPCSGNFATDRQWFRRRTIEDVERNAGLQREILAKTARVLKDSGEIVYSTCSLEPEEDELNINWALQNLNLRTEPINCPGQQGLTDIFGKQLHHSVVNCRRIWPRETQGFFVCKLAKEEGKR